MPTPKQYADALSSPSWTDRALPMEGRATFLPFQDTMPGSVMNKRSLAIPGVFAGAINAITAPGRAYRGSDPTFNPQEEALNIGLNMMGGGMVASKIAPPPAGSLGIFAGSRAKTADMGALKVAEDMKASGVSDEAIHAKTGWFFGSADGKPRFEIDDSGAKGQFTHLPPSTDRLTEQALIHPSLYKEYPELSKINQIGLKQGRETGSFSPTYVDKKFNSGSLVAQAPNETGIKSVGLHELQHAIQQTEGFASGGTPKEFKNKRIPPKLKDVSFTRDMNEIAISQRLQKFGMGVGEGKYLSLNEPKTLAVAEELAKTDGVLAEALAKFKDANFKLSKYPSAYTQYRNLSGEAEARLTQSRMNMNPAERAASYPPSMFDVPVKDQIVRYVDGQAMSVPKFPKTDGEIRSEIAQRNAALPISEGGLGLPANNMPMDRAGAMGLDTPAYHGRYSDYAEPKGTMYTTPDPEYASIYTNPSASSMGKSAVDYDNLQPNVMPLLLRSKDVLDTRTALGKKVFDKEFLGQYGNSTPLSERGLPDWVDAHDFGDMFTDKGLPYKAVLADEGGVPNMAGGVTHRGFSTAVFDPTAIRSRFAAFDPFRKHEADILAGVGIGGMLDPEAVSEEFRKKERK